MLRALVVVAYLAIGLVVASNNGYLNDLDTLARVISAVLGVGLWPLVLLGVDLHIGDVPRVKKDGG